MPGLMKSENRLKVGREAVRQVGQKNKLRGPYNTAENKP